MRAMAGSSWTDASLGCPRAVQVPSLLLPALQAIDLIILDGTEQQVCAIAPPITPLHTPVRTAHAIGEVASHFISNPIRARHTYLHPPGTLCARRRDPASTF